MSILYLEYAFKVAPLQPASDILIAELGEAGFESFVENDEGILAYINKEDWDESVVENIDILQNPKFTIDYSFKEIEQENWNATWERNFEPIKVGDDCVVRAPFHEKPNVKFDIIIEPKMSFGTGHHETTYMMLHFLLEMDVRGKTVLDMGSGTGVLAILAAMKGAERIDAIDIDNWCYLNALENVGRNDCHHISVHEGDASLLGHTSYDLIIANINRNILISDIPVYSEHLKKNGQLLLSGFYEKDIPSITEICAQSGLKFEKNIEKNHWAAVKYVF
ncbi:50S ribosomal protein L11 methyltransferase [Pareuzebyella sediminis]|uniref:50S ribosomal protein L11 methyltransferase n=1 Tax=Pareuzebyella sediminis TaxID=2607998 RepID=UPI0011F04D16|nr:50S ribosomal protein L11 methyltransferase [Pareuzebyella sediminis]